MRAIGDGPRNFKRWSRDEDETQLFTPSPNYPTTPTGGRLTSLQINVHRFPTRLELMTCLPRKCPGMEEEATETQEETVPAEN
ncbi:hypothetical protein TNCV_3096741 [Trichonephila clavipes]|uniref:Uncharacterized protein n=1 Tax=Trichonephila clavipes TaxID=2585209 RepID=A0A8X6SJ14_TRICX|nr:hypothetical protein TNCV_3096741 [Trichonephila clavipes]